jgi:tetratricopeptide (TPR) repeat protein
MIQFEIRPALAVFLFVISLFTQADAQTVQRGKVVLQNSGYKILPGTQLTAYGAQPTDTDNEGVFQLNFDKAEPGDMAPLKEAYKKGYELVNKKETEKWILSNTKDMIVVMCQEGLLKEARGKYYNIGSNTYVRRYEETLKELEKQKEINRITEKEYANRLEEAYNELENSQKLLSEYAELFSRINRDDLNDLEEKAFLLLDEGKPDEAIALYENEKLVEKLNSQIQIEKTATGEINEIIPSLKRYAEICIFAGGKENIEKASEIYRTVATADPDNFENLLTYGMFLKEQNDYVSAMEWCAKALQSATLKEQIAKSHCELGEVYDLQNIHDKSESSYKRGLEIYATLEAGDYSGRHISDHAAALRHLGRLYTEINRLDEALALYQQGLDKITPHISSDSAKYIPLTVDLYNCIGNVSSKILRESSGIDAKSIEKLLLKSKDYLTWMMERDSVTHIELIIESKAMSGLFHFTNKDFYKAEEASIDAIHTLEALYEKQPDKIRPALSDMYNNLAHIYGGMKQFQPAEKFYIKALNIREYLADNNPNAFAYKLAGTYRDIGNIYILMLEYGKAWDYLFKSKEIIEHIVKNDPQTYLPDLINTYSALGMNYYYSGDTEKSEEYYLKAVQLIKENPFLELDKMLKSVYGNLTSLYLEVKKYDDARHYAMESLSLAKNLFDKNNEAFSSELLITYNKLAALLMSMKDFPGADKYINEGLELCKSLVNKHPDVYLPDLALIYRKYGSIMAFLKKNKQAEDAYAKSMEIYDALITKGERQYKKDLGMVNFDCGGYYLSRGKYGQAEVFLTRTWQISKELVDENPNAGYELVFDSYYILIVLYDNMGNEKSLNQYTNEYIDIVKNIEYNYSALTGKNINKLTGSIRDVLNVLQLKKQSRSMLDLSLSGISLFEKLISDKLVHDKKDLYFLYGEAGNIYYKEGNYELARTYLEEYFFNTDIPFDEEHVNDLVYYAKSCDNLSFMYAENECFDLTADVLKSLLATMEFLKLHIKGISSDQIKDVREALSMLEGRVTESREIFSALETKKATAEIDYYGNKNLVGLEEKLKSIKGHARYIIEYDRPLSYRLITDIYISLADAYMDANSPQFNRAVDSCFFYAAKTVDLNKRKYGHFFIDVCNKLALRLSLNGDYAKAATICLKNIGIHDFLLNADSSQYLLPRNELYRLAGFYYHQSQDYPKAREYCLLYKELQYPHLGDNEAMHLDYNKNLTFLRSCYSNDGDTGKELETLKELLLIYEKLENISPGKYKKEMESTNESIGLMEDTQRLKQILEEKKKNI